MPSTPPDVAVIVLAGGRSRRFGRDKLAEVVDGHALLDGALTAAQDHASQVLVVGPRREDLPAAFVQVQEEPAYSGPFAAVATALPYVEAGTVVVLAGDLLDPGPLLPLLLQALESEPEADAAVTVDPEGRRQPLLAAFRVAALRAGIAGVDPFNRGAYTLLDGLRLVEVHDPAHWSRDIDFTDDIPAPRQVRE
jgi:molybdopterin-guanine dinucleotide biosynthesis protein A